MDMNCMNSKSGVLISVLVGIVMLSAITSNTNTYADRFHGPIDVAVDPSGNVFVTVNNIQKFTNNGKFIREWGTEGSGNGQFDNPYGIAIDPNGYVFVTDNVNDRIQKFSNTGKYIRQWGSVGPGKGLYDHPSGIALDSKGFVFVVDNINDTIRRFTNTGHATGEWNGIGSGREGGNITTSSLSSPF
jgi:tripartite motif-containing protein 71